MKNELRRTKEVLFRNALVCENTKCCLSVQVVVDLNMSDMFILNFDLHFLRGCIYKRIED